MFKLTFEKTAKSQLGNHCSGDRPGGNFSFAPSGLPLKLPTDFTPKVELPCIEHPKRTAFLPEPNALPCRKLLCCHPHTMSQSCVSLSANC